jgi:hypothetical protein
MGTPMYAVRLKSVSRYHYRGILYRRLDENRQVIDHHVTRELRDHFVGSKYWLDVRPEEPEPVQPVAIPEPVAVEPVAVEESSNDMSNNSITGPRTYGQPGKGDTQTEV